MKVTKEDTLLFNLMFLALFLATAANWARVIFPMLAVPWKFHGWDTGLSAPWSLMIFVCIGVECCLIFAASLAIYAAYKGYDYMTLNGT